MVIDVSQALLAPGEVYTFHLEEMWDSIEFNGDIYRFVAPIKVMGTYQYTGENFFVKGSIATELEAVCYRCLEPFILIFQTEFDEEFAQTNDEENPDRYLYVGKIIPLDEMIKDNILLNLPMKNICQAECKGLCENCGVNLNKGQCHCHKEIKEDHPFAALRFLLSDDKEV